MMPREASSSAPITTRSGRMKSWMAAPSRRNSGFEAMPKAMLRPSASSSSWISVRTRAEVPTGTVLLVTMTL